MAEEFERAPQPQGAQETPDTPAEEKQPRRPGADLFEWLQMLMVCILAAVVVFNCLARLTRVDGHSMDNTLHDGELMLVWSLGYTPKQGDIVVINKTTATFLGGNGDKAIVKRVIALGGQTVDVDYASNTVYVDGEPLDEPYIKEPMSLPLSDTMQQTHWEVPDGSIFVMGDNRNHSSDSRDVTLGTVDTRYLLGKAEFICFPFSDFGRIG